MRGGIGFSFATDALGRVPRRGGQAAGGGEPVTDPRRPPRCRAHVPRLSERDAGPEDARAARARGARARMSRGKDLTDPPVGELVRDRRPGDTGAGRRDSGAAVRPPCAARARTGDGVLPRRRLRHRRSRHACQLLRRAGAGARPGRRGGRLPARARGERLARRARRLPRPRRAGSAGSPAELGRQA